MFSSQVYNHALLQKSRHSAIMCIKSEVALWLWEGEWSTLSYVSLKEFRCNSIQAAKNEILSLLQSSSLPGNLQYHGMKEEISHVYLQGFASSHNRNP